jgi:hypothetical protein
MFVELSGASRARSMPLGYGCKKQDGTCLHTPEAETVSLAIFTRNEFLPIQCLLQIILRRPIEMFVHEDNESCIAISKKGYSPSLRALPRTHRLSIGVCHETYYEPVPEGYGKNMLSYVSSKEQKGDLMTKYLSHPELEHALSLIQVKKLSEF